MPQRKKQFRFKIPWISGARAPPPPASATESQSHGPKQRSKSPAEPDTNVPKQRPPFRPPGIAPAPPQSPPTQAQGTPRGVPQQQSPASSVIIGSPVSSPSSRPSTPTGVDSPLPSPSRTNQSQYSSPSHASSPSHFPSGHIIEVPPKPIVEESTHSASSGSELEKKKIKSPESEPRVKSPPLQTIPNSRAPSVPSSPISKTPSQPLNTPSHSASAHINEVLKESTLHASSSSPQQKDSEPLWQESEPKKKSPLKTIPKEPSEAKEKALLLHEPIKVGKGNDMKHGQSTRRSKGELHTTSSPSGVKTKDAFTRTIRADRKQKETRETVERKMMFATSSSSGKDIQVVSSADPATRNVSSIPNEKPVTSNEEKPHLQKGIKDDISNFVHKLATVNPTQPMDDKNVSVVTLAGDNKGATMHVGSHSTKREGSIHIHRAYRTNPEESTEATTDGEETSSRNSMEKDDVGKAYVNSNIQSVNNSLMLHGSVTERDPGVRVILPQQPADQPIKPVETPKAQVHIRRAEKLPYQPVVRRRCLRGLFLEPSDSDPDNPDKPRRHGCKFRCGDIGKNTEIM